MDSPQSAENRTRKHFLFLLMFFASIDLLCWRQLFSLRLLVMTDRGSFLNLDYLVRQHLRLGVDTYYSYGLLPVWIQHWLFAAFGMGYWPLLGCAVVTMILMAWFWAHLLGYLPKEPIWLPAILSTSLLIHWVNPNFPYSLVQLSMLFGLLFVLMGRLDIALAAASVGIWSVPSLPIVLTALIAGCILLRWSLQSKRRIAELVRSLAPGILTYVAVGLLLILEFGPASVFATATPLAGMKFYGEIQYGLGTTLLNFIHPPYHTNAYYLAYTLGSPVSWWVFSVCGLTIFGLLSIRRMLIARALNNRDLAIVLCAIVHAVFIGFAYGSAQQYYVYVPVLVAGMVLGLSTVPRGKLRVALLAIYMGLGILGQASSVRATISDWKTVKSEAMTANLYAPADWVAEWSHILDLSRSHNLLLLSYSTGVHDYFPTVHSPDAWTLQRGQLNPADKGRLMLKLRSADVVAVDRNNSTAFVDNDADVQQYLKSLCLEESTEYFQVWWRRTPGLTDHECRSSTQAGAPGASN